MAIPYPSSPSVGDKFTYNGVIYTWSGTAWISVANNTTGQVGSVFVTSPITNTGTPTAPVIGINQAGLSISATQVSGTAVTVSSGRAIPAGGTAGQVLSKVDATDYNTTWSTPSAGSSFTGGTLSSNLTLVAGNTSVYPMTFQSNAGTPTANLGSLDFDGTVFYKTANTNPGRALDVQTYYYVGTWTPDFTSSTTAQSFLGGGTAGITLAAGTTYDYEFHAKVKFQIIGTANAASGAYSIVKTGAATTTFDTVLEYGNNTTGFTTATTLSMVSNSGVSLTFSPNTTTGSRFSFLRVKGLIRVTGSGTAKIYPALTPSALMTNSDPNFSLWEVSTMIFKLTPVGNGTVTTVGAIS